MDVGGHSCRACGGEVAAAGLVLLRGDPQRAVEPPAEVPLVREYKGPTVDEVLAASSGALDLLPGRVLSMARSVASDDLPEADRQLGLALGLLHQGPGHRTAWRRLVARPAALLWTVLWVWFAVLVGLLAWFAL